MRDRRLDYPLVTKLLARQLGVTEPEMVEGFGPVRNEELESLLELRRTHDKTEPRLDDPAYLTWRYDLSGTDPGRAIWGFRHRGELIGTLGVEMDMFSYRGHDFPVHRMMDILAREDYMGVGLGVWMNLRLQQVFENTLCIGSTPYSHSIVTGLNTVMPDWQTWRHPISLRHRGAIQGGVDVALKAARLLLRLGVSRGAELVPGDERLDDIEALRTSMSQHVIMPSRSATKAEQRFGRHPYRSYEHYALTLDGRTDAAVTVSRSGRRAEIADALVRLPPDTAPAPKALADLLTLVTGRLAEDGVQVVSTRVNDPIYADALRRAGFVRRDEPCALGHHFKDPTLAKAIEEGVPLFLTPGDSDFD